MVASCSSKALAELCKGLKQAEEVEGARGEDRRALQEESKAQQKLLLEKVKVSGSHSFP